MTVILSPNRHVGRRAPIRLVVLHTMEVAEGDVNVAESVGNAFANLSRQASAHVGVDTNSECRYVEDADTAWAAPGCNADGLQLEMAGRAGQTTGQWDDAASRAILERAALRTAIWCRTYGIPAKHLTDAELKAGQRGIVDHYAATRVYRLSTHTDVGAHFPWASFMARVQGLLGGAVAKPQAKPLRPVATRIRLAADGDFGPRTKARLQQWAGARPDSTLTASDWMRVQRKVHVTPDGDPGRNTWNHISLLVKAGPTGGPDVNTIRHLQSYLNSH